MIFAQKKKKQDVFFGMEGQVGFDFGSILSKKDYNNVDNNEKMQFSYGVNSYVGYHFVPHFSISTALKYNYVTPNFHPIYWTFQTTYHFNITNENTNFAGLYYGRSINHTNLREISTIFGLKIGMLTPAKKFLNLTASGFLEHQSLDGRNNMFIGLNVGAQIFTGKNNYYKR